MGSVTSKLSVEYVARRAGPNRKKGITRTEQ
jgi:hypothetical protein